MSYLEQRARVDQPQSLPGVQDGSKKGYTSRYLTAVQAATNTVSTWLQKDNALDSGLPSPVAAAARQLHDERPLRKTTEVAPPHSPLPLLQQSIVHTSRKSPCLGGCPPRVCCAMRLRAPLL